MTVSVARLTGVYHADGGVRGELAYLLGRWRGTAHCSLCDVTHGVLRRRQQWDDLVERLGVPFDLVHRDERSAEVVAAGTTGTPYVLGQPAGAPPLVLLGPADLEGLAGDVDRFEAALRAGLHRAGLHLASDPATGGP